VLKALGNPEDPAVESSAEDLCWLLAERMSQLNGGRGAVRLSEASTSAYACHELNWFGSVSRVLVG
jgi:hypothetical protein